MVRLATDWRDGQLPETGGVLDQAAWTTEAVKIVMSAWAKLEAARAKALRK